MLEIDLTRMTPAALFALHARVHEQLRESGVIRSANNPVGDYAEHLFCRAFGWTRLPNSHPSADAEGPDGALYQIKARRETRHSKNRQLGALRNLSEASFQYLAAAVFNEDYSVQRAALIPYLVVAGAARDQAHTNSKLFMLQNRVWDQEGVRDVTDRLRAVVV